MNRNLILGGLDEAVDWVAARAEIPAKTMVLRPKRGLAQLLMNRAASSMLDGIAVAAAERLQRASLGIPRR